MRKRSAILGQVERACEIMRDHGFLLDLGDPVSAEELVAAEQMTGLGFDGSLGDLFLTVNGSFGKTAAVVQSDEPTPCSLATLDQALAWGSEWLPYGPQEHAQYGPGAEAGRDPRVKLEGTSTRDGSLSPNSTAGVRPSTSMQTPDP